jgi:hypothetical protein
MEHGWSGTETGNPMYSEKSLSVAHCSPQIPHGLAILIHINPVHTSERTEHASIRETSHLILERKINVVKTSDICEIHT